MVLEKVSVQKEKVSGETLKVSGETLSPFFSGYVAVKFDAKFHTCFGCDYAFYEVFWVKEVAASLQAFYHAAFFESGYCGVDCVVG